MPNRLLVLTAAALCLGALARPARAGGGIVLEAYTRERPADAQRIVGPIVDELTRINKVEAGDQLVREYEASVSKPPTTAQGMPADFAAQVDRGFQAWVSGKFNDAISILNPLVERAHANCGLFAQNQALREPLAKALIALALADQRNGDLAPMRATFVEYLHSYDNAAVPRGTYGQGAFEAFEDARRDVAAAGAGKLTVTLAQNGGVVFVNEQYKGQGSTQLELPPGDYRVLVLLDKRPSRAHVVTVAANVETTVTIDAAADQAIHTEKWTGFLFATDADRDAHAGLYAADFANAIKAPSVAVLAIEQSNGRAAIVGSLVSLGDGHEIRRASVALHPDPSVDQLKALAAFLAGQKATSGITVEQVGAHDPPPAPAKTAGDNALVSAQLQPPPASQVPVDDGAAATGGRWGGWKYLAAGGAVAGIASGIYFAVEDGKCENTPPAGGVCTSLYAYSPFQYVALGAGAALAVAAGYLFATTSHEHAAARSAFVVPMRDGAVAGLALTW